MNYTVRFEECGSGHAAKTATVQAEDASEARQLARLTLWPDSVWMPDSGLGSGYGQVVRRQPGGPDAYNCLTPRLSVTVRAQS